MKAMKTRSRHKTASHYQRLVCWSDKDSCFIGQCPALFMGGVHGDDEVKVTADLARAVEEHLAILRDDGNDAPAGDVQDYSGKLTIRIKPSLH